MKKVLMVLITTVFLTALMCTGINAATSGNWTYTVSGSKATITGYSGTESTVVIPSELGGYPVTAIGSMAFGGCSSITKVEFSTSITSVSGNVFNGCTNLKSIYIPKNITSFSSTFLNGSSVSIVVFDDGTLTIPSYAAGSGSNVISIIIPDTVTKISSNAFSKCTSLTGITIPESVTSVGYNVFADCTNLKNITIPKGIKSFDMSGFLGNSSVEKVTFQQGTEIIYAYALLNAKNVTSVTIPNTVTEIKSSVFQNCINLSTISIPNSVKTVGVNVFAGCTNLKSIKIPSSITSFGYSTSSGFLTDSSIETVTFEEGIQEISANTVRHGTNIKSIIIPDSVITIGGSAFSYCTTLESITLSNNLQSIQSTMFYECTSLQSIIIPESVTEIGSSAFYHCTSLLSVVVPGSVKKIGSSAFSGCTSLMSVTLSEGIESVGAHMFNGCTNLKSIIIPKSIEAFESLTLVVGGTYYFLSGSNIETLEFVQGTEVIGANSALGAEYLKNVIIPNTVTTIGSSAFQSCKKLEAIIIPNSVTTIGNSAFSNCTSLSALSMPNSVTEIGGGAFAYCTSLTSIFIPKTLLTYSKAFWASGIKSVIIEEGALSIPNEAFYSCRELESITIPSSITSIGNGAFQSCEKLKSITIPNSILTIGNNTFSSCSTLTEVTLSDNVTSIGYGAFTSCSSLTEIVIPKSLTSYGNSYYASAFTGSGITKVTIEYGATSIPAYGFKSCTKLEIIEIPNTVTTIGASAFIDCTKLETIEIPNTVTTIGSSAFENCTNLVNVNLPSEITTINSGIFQSCKNLANIKLPNSVTRIYSSAFQSCTNLEAIEIPDTVTSIGSTAFSGCINITEIFIPKSLVSYASAFTGSGITKVTIEYGATSIPQSAFSGCKNLETIEIPDTVTTIAMQAFSGCTNLINIKLPSQITTISNYAFQNCTNITSIEIPEKVTALGMYAFSGCSKLSTIIFHGDKPASLQATTFNQTASDFTIYYYYNPSSTWTTPTWNEYPCYPIMSDKDEFDYAILDKNEKTATIIGYYGFDTHIKIPDSVNLNTPDGIIEHTIISISNNVFYHNKDIAMLILPERLKYIASATFEGFSNLESITIPSGVTQINAWAFKDCVNLKHVTFEGDAFMFIDIFENTHPDLTLYYYEDTEYWTPPEWCGYKIAMIPSAYTPIEKRLNAVMAYYVPEETYFVSERTGDYDTDDKSNKWYKNLNGDKNYNCTHGTNSHGFHNGGWQCNGFVRYVAEKLYDAPLAFEFHGVPAVNTYSHTMLSHCGIYPNRKSVTPENVQELLNNAKKGDIIQGTYGCGNPNGHSMIFLEHTFDNDGNKDGIKVYDANYDDKCGVHTRVVTYKTLAVTYTHTLSLMKYTGIIRNHEEHRATCPINMEVYDPQGNLITILEDGVESYLENEYGVFQVYYDESIGEYVKSACLYDFNCTIKIIGTDSGTMNYSVKYKNTTNSNTYIYYDDIRITPAMNITPEIELNNDVYNLMVSEGNNDTIINANYVVSNEYGALTQSNDTGVKITGTVSSYNARNDITVTLWQNGEATEYHTIISGVESSSNKRYENMFTLENIPDGSYDLVITKQCHLPFTIKDIVVNSSDIDISEYILKMAAGDVNDNGAINLTDISDIYNSGRFNKVETNNDGYNIVYDVNGNGAIELSDISIVYDSYNFQKTVVEIDYDRILNSINNQI